VTKDAFRADDHVLHGAVRAELEASPEIVSEAVGIEVIDGTVTLTGHVSDPSTRNAIARAACRAAGVTTVVDEVTVLHEPRAHEITETDIARGVRDAMVPLSASDGSVRATLRGDTVTLTGRVPQSCRSDDVRRAVAAVPGVTYVVNKTTVVPRPSAEGAEAVIRSALLRIGAFDAENVHVAAEGTTLILSGRVESWDERDVAATTAWSSARVDLVLNQITIASRR
jgi:osmotically-inducible protein OsmY